MRQNKTVETDASVAAYLQAIVDETRREDCRALLQLMTRVSGYEAKMWGTGIVGFGSYHYRYASGHEGDACLAGFASRKGDISVYLMCGDSERTALLARLGKHRMGKGCLYIRRLADVEMEVLAELIAHSIAGIRQRYPGN